MLLIEQKSKTVGKLEILRIKECVFRAFSKKMAWANKLRSKAVTFYLKSLKMEVFAAFLLLKMAVMFLLLPSFSKVFADLQNKWEMARNACCTCTTNLIHDIRALPTVSLVCCASVSSRLTSSWSAIDLFYATVHGPLCAHLCSLFPQHNGISDQTYWMCKITLI